MNQKRPKVQNVKFDQLLVWLTIQLFLCITWSNQHRDTIKTTSLYYTTHKMREPKQVFVRQHKERAAKKED